MAVNENGIDPDAAMSAAAVVDALDRLGSAEERSAFLAGLEMGIGYGFTSAASAMESIRDQMPASVRRMIGAVAAAYDTPADAPVVAPVRSEEEAS